jgi:phosphatidylglycerophosphate synthase
MGIVGGVGRWLDSIADIVFILTALTCEAAAGAIPFYIPLLIALSFSQYAIDSKLLSGAPIKSRLGHFGGIINFALVIVLGLAAPPAWPGVMLQAICPLLAIFYIAAICERAVGYFRRG